MTMIVTKSGKSGYNHLPIGIYALGDIFQDKVDKLISDIEGVKTYIDDILVLSKEGLSNHIYHIRVVFASLCTAGLKCNAP